MQLTEYDAMLLKLSTDHRRFVDSYTFMLLGREAPKYFQVEKKYKQVESELDEDIMERLAYYMGNNK